MKSYFVNLDNLKEISKEIKRLYNKSKILIIDGKPSFPARLSLQV